MRVDYVVTAVEERVREREDEERRAVPDPVQDADVARHRAGHGLEVRPVREVGDRDRKVERDRGLGDRLDDPDVLRDGRDDEVRVRERRQLRPVEREDSCRHVDDAPGSGQRADRDLLALPEAVEEPRAGRARQRVRADVVDGARGGLRCVVRRATECEFLADREAVREERAGAGPRRDHRDRPGRVADARGSEGDDDAFVMRHRLRPEVVQRLGVRIAAVPDAVLRRVAVDHERRIAVVRLAGTGAHRQHGDRCAGGQPDRAAQYEVVRKDTVDREDATQAAAEDHLLVRREAVGDERAEVGARDRGTAGRHVPAEARAGERDRVAAHPDERDEAAGLRPARDGAAAKRERLPVEADRVDHPRAVVDAGDPDELAHREACGSEGAGRGKDGAAGRAGRQRQVAGELVAAREGDGPDERRTGKRAPVDDEHSAVARRPVGVADDRSHALAGHVDSRADGEAEALPRLAVRERDAVERSGDARHGLAGRVGERPADGEGVGDSDLAGLRRRFGLRDAAEEHRVARPADVGRREAREGVRVAVRQRDLLADNEAEPRPRETVGAREGDDRADAVGGRSRDRERAVDLERLVAAAVHCGDAAVVRELAAQPGDRVEVAARLQRRGDRQVVVALAEHDGC